MIPSPSIKKFLDLIAWSEGTSTSPATRCDGYDVIVSGPDGREVFTDFSTHPFMARAPKLVRPGLHSTASGRYQILRDIFVAYQERLHLPDFSPLSQDKIAIQLITERHAIQPILDGRIQDAIKLCCSTWASFPFNDFQQNAHTVGTLLNKWGTIPEDV
jgi:muramidase (phage lysozyme)